MSKLTFRDLLDRLPLGVKAGKLPEIRKKHAVEECTTCMIPPTVVHGLVQVYRVMAILSGERERESERDYPCALERGTGI